MVEFEWDEAKRLSNVEKHGLDFEDAKAMFDGRAFVSLISARNDETRFVTTAELDGLLYTVIWTDRSKAIRIISMRRARDAEEREYRAVHG